MALVKTMTRFHKQVAGLKGIGYECSMIFVNTSLDTAQERNRQRSRTLPEKEVEAMWNGVQQNMGKFQRLFGASNMIIVDNNDAGEDVFNKVWKQNRNVDLQKSVNPTAKRWISQELIKKDDNFFSKKH